MSNTTIHRVQAILATSSGTLLFALAILSYLSKSMYSGKYIIAFSAFAWSVAICVIWIRLRTILSTPVALTIVSIVYAFLLLADFASRSFMDEIFQLTLFSVDSVLIFSEGITIWLKIKIAIAKTPQ
ncbi:MAG: hypothetical protein HZB19_11935 [Chloroflexi bacterium]|nr:hypothetical protein [Chloroflexota bacterium]